LPIYSSLNSMGLISLEHPFRNTFTPSCLHTVCLCSTSDISRELCTISWVVKDVRPLQLNWILKFMPATMQCHALFYLSLTLYCYAYVADAKKNIQDWTTNALLSGSVRSHLQSAFGVWTTTYSYDLVIRIVLYNLQITCDWSLGCVCFDVFCWLCASCWAGPLGRKNCFKAVYQLDVYCYWNFNKIFLYKKTMYG
jgi:hypothetical protein